MNVFHRVIASGRYRPEIDGLRFIAIISVLLFHIDAFLNLYMNEDSLFTPIFKTGHLGVQLFFSISGFVLMSQLIRAKNFKYSKYLIRRIERIEPPFLITSLLFYAILTFRDGFNSDLNYSLFRVITYSSNFSENLINVVTWSLEIEVVFYLLLPLIYKVAKTSIWKWFILATISFIFSQFYKWPFLTSYLHWFVAGIIIAIIENKKGKRIIPLNGWAAGISIVVFFMLGVLDNSIIINLLQTLLLFCFLYAVIINKIFLKVLSFRLISTIGGACYTIYLLHFPVVSFFGHKIVEWFSGYRELALFLVLILTLIICMLAFPIIERPFMKKGWWKFNKDKFSIKKLFN